jgi:hypothetical protein
VAHHRRPASLTVAAAAVWARPVSRTAAALVAPGVVPAQLAAAALPVHTLIAVWEGRGGVEDIEWDPWCLSRVMSINFISIGQLIGLYSLKELHSLHFI